MRKPADFCVEAAVSLWSLLLKMFDLKFQNHTWCRPLSPFAGGAKLSSNCKKIFCRPPVVVVQHDHHQRQCHTCHSEEVERLQMGSGCTFPLFFCCIFCSTYIHVLLCICYIFCSTYSALLLQCFSIMRAQIWSLNAFYWEGISFTTTLKSPVR